MRQFVVVVIVALLTVSMSGVSSLVLPEPCTADESAGNQDDTCPPTCVTCGCCGQAAQAVMVVLTRSVDLPTLDALTSFPKVPKTHPRDILHVPKIFLA